MKTVKHVILKLFSITFLLTPFFSIAREVSTEDEPELSISGYVDAYYSYNLTFGLAVISKF